jgi:hypothetical protein
MPTPDTAQTSHSPSHIPIPSDIISHIVKFCSQSTLSILSRVSRECNALAIPKLYSYLDLSLPNPLVAFDQDAGIMSTCNDNDNFLITPPHLQHTRAMFIPAHHHTQCFAGSSLTPTTTTILLPKLHSVHYKIDTLMYHWQYNCTLMRSFTPGPEELILSAKGFDSILYWTFATQCYEQTPPQIKTLALLIEESGRNAGGWKFKQTGRLRNLGSVRRMIVAGVKGQPAREIILVYTLEIKEMTRSLESGEIEDIAT